jgi:CCR4-NOT transcription complex subunit 1
VCLASYLSPSTPVFMQIRSIVSSLALKKVTKGVKNELLQVVVLLMQLVNANGWEAEKFMFLCLLQHIDLKEIKEKGTLQKVALLGELLGTFSPRENFLFYLPEALAQVSKGPGEYAQAMLKYLKLQVHTQIIMALALYLSDNPQLSREGEGMMKAKLNEYYHMGKPVEFPPKVLQELLFQIGRNPQLLEELEEEYQYLLETSSPDRVPESRCYHYLNDNYRVTAYEVPTISKTNELIKKSELLRDLGPYCTFNMESLKIALNELGQLTEEDVFECLMLMSEDHVYVGDSLDRFMTDLMVANKKFLKAEEWRKFYQNQDLTEKRMQAAWDVDAFLTYAVQNVPNLKWTSVMGYFDRLDLEVTSHEAFLNMFRFFQKAKKKGPKFKTPEILFFKKWNHPRSQLQFLLQVFKCQQPDLLGLSEISNKKVAKWLADSLKSSPNQYSLQVQMWGYLDMVQLLIELSDYDFMAARELMDVPLSRFPDLLLQTLSEMRVSRGDALLDEVFSALFPAYLSNHTSYMRLLETVWENNDDLVISSICELYKNENKKENSCLNLSRVLDITQNIRESLIPLTYWNDYSFAVALGILAGKREFLHFEQWIKERLKNIGAPFLNAVLAYVEENLLKYIREITIKFGANNPAVPQSYDIALEKAQLSRELLAFIFESALQISGSKFSVRTVENLKRLYKEICEYFPEMSESQMPDEIEMMAEKHFQRIYREEITLEAAIDMMQRLKKSSKQDDKELYASMITFLFTELRFHSNYPEKELMITANFFSAIINA